MWDDDPFLELEWSITRAEAEELLLNEGFEAAVQKQYRKVARTKHKIKVSIRMPSSCFTA